jgi:hypothetical protein
LKANPAILWKEQKPSLKKIAPAFSVAGAFVYSEARDQKSDDFRRAGTPTKIIRLLRSIGTYELVYFLTSYLCLLTSFYSGHDQRQHFTFTRVIMLSGFSQPVQYVNLYSNYAACNDHIVIHGIGI